MVTLHYLIKKPVTIFQIGKNNFEYVGHQEFSFRKSLQGGLKF